MRRAIGKPDGDLYTHDVAGLTNLRVSRAGVASLAGLEHCVALEYLNLSSNAVQDISPLASLVNLRQLQLGQNEIEDLAPLAALSNRLSLASNGITFPIWVHCRNAPT